MADTIKFGLQLELNGNQAVIRGLDGTRHAVADLDREVDSHTRTTQTAAETNRSFAGSFGQLSTQVKAFGGIIAAVGLTQFVRDLYATNAEAQRLNASLVTVTGSQQAASAAWAELEQFATTTPYQLEQSINAFVKMQALGLDPTIPKLRSLGNTASAMGKDLEQMIEAVADASTGEFERLKEFGIKASSEGDKVRMTFQGTTREIRKDAADITQYLLEIGDTEFAGAMERQMDTLGGAMSNLGDNVDALMRAIGESGGNAGLSGAINWLSESVQSLTGIIDGPTIQALEEDIARVEAALEGGRRRNQVSSSALEEKLASLREELLRLKAAKGDVESIEQIIASLNAQIDELEGSGASGRNKAAVNQRLASLNEQLRIYEQRLEAANASTDESTGKQDESAEAISRSSQALIDKIAVIETENQLLALGYSLEDAKYQAAYEHADDLNRQLLTQQRNQQRILDGLEDEAAVLEDLDAQWQKVLDAAIDRRETFADLESDIQLPQRELIAIQGGEAALRAFNREKAIEVALRSQNTEEWLPEEIARYRELVGQQYDLQTQVEILTNQADPYAELWIAALERVDEAFADAWAGAFDSFEDFADELENAFKRLLGELAHQAITQPIIVQVQGFFTGTGGGLGAGSGSAGGLPPGTSQAAGALFSYGAEGFSGYGASALGIQGQGAVSATTQVAPWASALAGGYMGYQNSGARGAATGAAGGYYGAQAGASIGAYGGPIGAIAGAVIGGVLGALGGSRAFGGSKELFNAGYELGIDSGELVVSGFNKWKKDKGVFGGGNKTSSNVFDLAPDIENAFNSTIEGTKSTLIDAYAALGIEISDAAFDGLTIAAERIGTRKKSDEEFAAAIEAMIADFADQLALAASDATPELGNDRTIADSMAEVTALANALTGANNILRTFGRETLDVSVSGAQAAQNMIALAGGIDQLLAISQAAYHVDTAFGLADGLDPLRAVLNDLGFTLADVEAAAESGTDKIGELFADLSDAEKAALQPFIDTIQSLVPELDAATDSTDAWADSVQDALSNVLAAVDAEQQAIDEAHNARINALRAERDEITAQLDQLRSNIDAAFSGMQRWADAERTRINSDAESALAELNARRDAAESSYNQSIADLNAAIAPVTDSIANLESLAGALQSTIDGMSPGVREFDRYARQFAQRQLTDILAGSELPSADRIAPVLDALSQDSRSQFRDRTEYLRDFYTTQNQMAALLGRTEGQLSTDEQTLNTLQQQTDAAEAFYQQQLTGIAEQIDQTESYRNEQLSAIDQQLTLAQAQIDAALGIDTSLATLQDVTRAIATYEQSASLFDQRTTQIDRQIEQSTIEHDAEIARLDAIAAQAEQQVAALLGVDNSVQSVASAVAALQSTIGTSSWAFAANDPFATSAGPQQFVDRVGPPLESAAPGYNASSASAQPANSEVLQVLSRIESLLQTMAQDGDLTEENVDYIYRKLQQWDVQGMPTRSVA